MLSSSTTTNKGECTCTFNSNSNTFSTSSSLSCFHHQTPKTHKPTMEDTTLWKEINLPSFDTTTTTNHYHYHTISAAATASNSPRCLSFQELLARPLMTAFTTTCSVVSPLTTVLSLSSQPLSVPSDQNLHNSALSCFGNTKRSLQSQASSNSGERRNKRMMKNRESAARSRARKQAYTYELQEKVKHLQEENARLKRQQQYLLCETTSSSAVVNNHEQKKKGGNLYRSYTAPF